jgi:hypothetical protein
MDTRTSKGSSFAILGLFVGERFSAERVIDWRGSSYELETMAGDSVAIAFDCTTEGNVGDEDWYTLVGVSF